MHTILFVELLGGIGDLLIALPAMQALGRTYPDAALTVLTFPPGGELLCHDPLIRHIAYLEPAADVQAVRHAVADFLTGHQFDLIVSDTRYGGIDREIERSSARSVTNLWRGPPPDERVGDRFLHILLREGVIDPQAVEPPQLHLTREEISRAHHALVDRRHPLVFLCPDSGMAIKRWPALSFIRLGRMLHEDGSSVVVVAGDDAAGAARIAATIPEATVWPRGELRTLAAAMRQADLTVAVDTGVAQLSATLGVPTITLFGPSWYGRYGQPAPHRNFQGYPACPERIIANFTEQRCWYSGTCPLGHWQTCLEDIAPEAVAEAAAALLAVPPLSPQPAIAG